MGGVVVGNEWVGGRRERERRETAKKNDRFATGTGMVVCVWWKDSPRPGTSHKGKPDAALQGRTSVVACDRHVGNKPGN